MISRQDFDSLLAEQETLTIDGALATELETRGHNLKHALWSGKILRESPSAITAVHRDYFLAGADIAITASYQASTRGLQQHLGLSADESTVLIAQSVHLAQQAREQAYAAGVPRSRRLLVAGSVGPYGAYLADGSEYTGAYDEAGSTREALQAFHRPRVQALVAAGADLLALETLPHLREIEALLDLLRVEFPGARAWVACTLRDARHISDGTPVVDVLRTLAARNEDGQVVAFGFNCVPPDVALEAVRCAAEMQAQEPALALPLLCYPNSGETWDAVEKVWLDDSALGDAEAFVRDCSAAGARLIGGCCRTGPQFVESLCKVVHTKGGA